MQRQKAEITNGGRWRNGATIQSLLEIREHNIREDMKVLAPASLFMIVDEDSIGSGEHRKAFDGAG